MGKAWMLITLIIGLEVSSFDMQMKDLHVTCDGKETLTVTVEWENEPMRLNPEFSLPQCPGQRPSMSQTDRTYTVSTNPYSCTGQVPDPNDPGSYSVELVFVVEPFQMMNANRVKLVKDQKITATCNFDRTYTVSAEMQDVNGPESWQIPSRANTTFENTFDMQIVENDWETVRQPPFMASQRVNFVINTEKAAGFDFMPTQCTVASKDYQEVSLAVWDISLMDTDCGYEHINFGLTQHEDQWRMKFDLFLLTRRVDGDIEGSGDDDFEPIRGDYVVTCNIEMCHKDAQGACRERYEKIMNMCH